MKWSVWVEESGDVWYELVERHSRPVSSVLGDVYVLAAIPIVSDVPKTMRLILETGTMEVDIDQLSKEVVSWLIDSGYSLDGRRRVLWREWHPVCWREWLSFNYADVLLCGQTISLHTSWMQADRTFSQFDWGAGFDVSWPVPAAIPGVAMDSAVAFRLQLTAKRNASVFIEREGHAFRVKDQVVARQFWTALNQLAQTVERVDTSAQVGDVVEYLGKRWTVIDRKQDRLQVVPISSGGNRRWISVSRGKVVDAKRRPPVL